jgi:hypothetical protein
MEIKEFFSKLEQSDFMAYFTECLYRTNMKLLINQLKSHAKWLIFTKRFEVMAEADQLLFECRKKHDKRTGATAAYFEQALRETIHPTEKVDIDSLTHMIDSCLKARSSAEMWPNLTHSADHPPIWPVVTAEIKTKLSTLCEFFHIEVQNFPKGSSFFDYVTALFQANWSAQNSFYSFHEYGVKSTPVVLETTIKETAHGLLVEQAMGKLESLGMFDRSKKAYVVQLAE